MKTVIDVFPTNEKNLEIINYSCCLFLACCSCQIHHSFSSLVDVCITTCTVKSYDRIPCDVEFILCSLPRNGELRTQKLKSHLVRTQSLNVLPFKPGVGQYIAIHATLTAREFFLAYFYPSSPFTCIFSKTSPNFFPVLACRIK